MTETLFDLSKGSFQGKAEFRRATTKITALFANDESTHVLSFHWGGNQPASGVTASILLEGWQSISYVAIGYVYQGVYRHIKVKHCKQAFPLNLRCCHDDLIWRLENNGVVTSPAEIDNIRLFVKGIPSTTGGLLTITAMGILSDTPSSVTEQLFNCKPDQELMTVITDYLKSSFSNYQLQATQFIRTGSCPMPGQQLLNWPAHSAKPPDLSLVNTFRFSWYALHPAISLLLYADENNDDVALMAARSFVEQWLNDSLCDNGGDSKYCWYDHGVAERQLALLVMWYLVTKKGCDYRFKLRLMEAIEQHAELLSSEAFYAYNQNSRYHNHAWFQDAALVATALYFADYPRSGFWMATAVRRFLDQLDTLIVRDSGYSVFVENSIGYHHGVQRLATFIGRLMSLSGIDSCIPAVANELNAWSDFFRYPDGRVPAQGDTFRLTPRTGDEIRRGKPWSETGWTVLPIAGYAVFKDNIDGLPLMLCLYATSLSATHKHEDHLHTTLWFDGVEWLIDPSFYSHEYAQPLPSHLRSAAAHNALTVQALEYQHRLRCTQLSSREDPNFVLTATHQAYDSCVVKRQISTPESGIINISDIIESLKEDSDEVHNATIALTFAENVSSSLKNRTIVLSSDDSNYELEITFTDQQATLQQGSCKTGLGFLQKEETQGIVANFMSCHEVSWLIKIRERTGRTDDVHSNTSIFDRNKVAIIGSCVTRDAFQFNPCAGITYFARTGFISLASKPVDINENSLEISGAFERRMIIADFKKTALDSIKKEKVDFVVLDFIDERFDLYQVGDSYVTRSNYMVQAFQHAIVAEKVIKKDQAKQLWVDSCEVVVSFLKELNVPVILHRAWWAEYYMNHDSGTLVKFSAEELVQIKKQNEMLSFYYDTIKGKFPAILEVEVESDLVYSDFAHKWGRDFFHYSDKYYARLIKIIEEMLVLSRRVL